MSCAQVSIATRLPLDNQAAAAGHYGTGCDAITHVSHARWDLEAPRNGKSQLRARFGGFLAGVDQFDAAQFGITIPEAELMDPQQRLLLEVTSSKSLAEKCWSNQMKSWGRG